MPAGKPTAAPPCAATPPPLLPVLAGVAFVVLLAVVIGDWAPVQRLDESLSARFRGYGTENPAVVDVIRVATDVMGTLAFLVIGAAVTLLLALTPGRRRAAGFCAAVTVAVPVLWSVMHVALHRPRPRGGFVDIDSNGFPSGHTSHAAATAIVAILLLWPRLGRRGRAVAVALGTAFAATIGLTRLVLLAHWPADVLGGWLLALTVVPTMALAFVGRERPAERAGGGRGGPAGAAG